MDKEVRASKSTQIIASLGACFGAFGLGTGLVWSSPALLAITGNENRTCINSDTCYYDDGDLLTPRESSWVASLYTIGCLVSSFVTGYLMSVIGRKGTMIVMSVPCTLGWIILVLCGPLNLHSAPWFYVARLLTGFGGGCYALAAPIYVSEIAEISLRGALGSCMQLLMVTGGFFGHLMGALIEWDIMTGVFLIFPVINATMMFFLPESPYYLLTKDKSLACQQSLKWLRGNNYDVTKEFEELLETKREQDEIGSISLKDFFTQRVYLKPGLIMLALMFFQQFAGINAVIFFLADIFAEADTGLDPKISAAIVALVQAVATGFAVLFVEKVGRKILLIVSALVMCLAIMALGIYFYIKEHTDQSGSSGDSFSLLGVGPEILSLRDHDLLDSLGWLPLTSLIVYIFFFSIGFGPLPWMMNGEFFSLEAKGLASALSTAFNWLCAFLVSKFDYNLRLLLGIDGTYFFYSAICALAALFVTLTVPETKGKTTEEMKLYFEKKTSGKIV